MNNASHILAKSIALLASLAALQSVHATNVILSGDTTINRALARVAFQGANSVTRLIQDGELAGPYIVETSPAGIVFDGRSIWVTNSGSNTVTQLDCITGFLIDTSPVGNSPLGLCFDRTAVWVANKTTSNLLRR